MTKLKGDVPVGAPVSIKVDFHFHESDIFAMPMKLRSLILNLAYLKTKEKQIMQPQMKIERQAFKFGALSPHQFQNLNCQSAAPVQHPR